LKRLVQKKSTARVAQEACHDPEEVEYYVQCLRRIKTSCDTAMNVEDIVLATGYSRSLVLEYLELADEFHLPPLKDVCEPHTVQAAHD
jgi:hypothetical protein